jgi:hypothetical protein
VLDAWRRFGVRGMNLCCQPEVTRGRCGIFVMRSAESGEGSGEAKRPLPPELFSNPWKLLHLWLLAWCHLEFRLEEMRSIISTLDLDDHGRRVTHNSSLGNAFIPLVGSVRSQPVIFEVFVLVPQALAFTMSLSFMKTNHPDDLT